MVLAFVPLLLIHKESPNPTPFTWHMFGVEKNFFKAVPLLQTTVITNICLAFFNCEFLSLKLNMSTIPSCIYCLRGGVKIAVIKTNDAQTARLAKLMYSEAEGEGNLGC